VIANNCWKKQEIGISRWISRQNHSFAEKGLFEKFQLLKKKSQFPKWQKFCLVGQSNEFLLSLGHLLKSRWSPSWIINQTIVVPHRGSVEELSNICRLGICGTKMSSSSWINSRPSACLVHPPSHLKEAS